jgi:hypothetical protein
MSEPQLTPSNATSFDPATMFRFPMILHSVTNALQPVRLVIALLMVTALITFGRVWDGSAGSSVPPAGLLAAPLSPSDVDAIQWTLQRECIIHRAMEDMPRLQSPEWPVLDAEQVLLDVEAAYRAKRERLVAGIADARADGDAALIEEREAVLDEEDGNFVRSVGQIRDVMQHGEFEAGADAVGAAFSGLMKGVVRCSPDQVAAEGKTLLIEIPLAVWDRHRLFGIVYALFGVIVIGLGGGALSRMTAAQVARQERISLRAAIDFALARPAVHVMTPLLPLMIMGVFALCIMLLGVLFRLPWHLGWLGGIAYGLALVLGLVVVILGLAYVAGFLMLLPAVACENCDSAEAQQRSFAYVLGRPAHLAWYVLVALVGLAIGYLLISIVAVALLDGTSAFVGLLAGDTPALAASGGVSVFDLRQQSVLPVHAVRIDRINAELIEFWQTVVLCVVPAYVLSYLFAAATRIYLLMRRACDGQSLSEIWQPAPPEWMKATDAADRPAQ